MCLLFGRFLHGQPSICALQSASRGEALSGAGHAHLPGRPGLTRVPRGHREMGPRDTWFTQPRKLTGPEETTEPPCPSEGTASTGLPRSREMGDVLGLSGPHRDERRRCRPAGRTQDTPSKRSSGFPEAASSIRAPVGRNPCYTTSLAPQAFESLGSRHWAELQVND